ncbi:hypothetical protein CcCBS67573_g06062 [Chytriomyces confervae]|uniref:Succinate dehydrogenase assembly factor 4, mitochondrial n=1 Tax=Chytriomyces confervae TaxID=246404 RepID=A0A507F6D0_9FUNG|nr:hypothetical protein CcCBS67573_g06062 [Chytriomyces confervae]
MLLRLLTKRAQPRCHATPLILARMNSGGAFKEQPGPVPLADRTKQLEFERLVKEFNDKSDQPHPDAPQNKPKAEFEGAKNPVTGEVNGPKGPEPTRFGDWEKNGRVYDF